MQQREPKVFAHRGASGVFFGNSFGAFDEALRQHTDGLETDAWQTRDGVIVLHHSKLIYPLHDSHPINLHKSHYAEIKDIQLQNGALME
jgi:glycerophosphoryl diester phosphodiesterase